MTKLIDIAARYVEEWPEDATVLRQDEDLEICFESNDPNHDVSRDFLANELAEDAEIKGGVGYRYITRAQWEAERARILAESSKSTEADKAHIAELTAIACGKRSKEDQVLWDKVAAEVFVDVLAISATSEGGAICACNAADAFMAERAKRMGGNK